MTSLKPFIHPDLSKQLSIASGPTAEVAAVAKHLAGLMQNIHGGSWRVQIEHEPNVSMIVIAPRTEKKGRAAS